MKFKDTPFETLASKEWLYTNGIGGYASTTISGMNTRRYHGLLVASKNPPTQRQVLVSGIAESISERRDTFIEISTNQYPGAIHPKGYQYLTEFQRHPFPQSTFKVGHQELTKTSFMVYGSNTTIVEYKNTGKSAYNLNLIPYFVDRDYHSLFHKDNRFDFSFEQSNNILKIYSQYGAEPLYVKFTSGDFLEERNWYEKTEYKKEEYRGLEYQEDRYAIGKVNHYLMPGKTIYLIFSTDPNILDKSPATLKKKEVNRQESLKGKLKGKNKFYDDLLVAGNQFIVNRASTDSYTILAGYHWFTDWGRDTMIAMRGLTIAPGNKKASKSILNTFFSYLDQGMLPNRFPDNTEDEVEYNTVDATLWLFIVLYEYHEKFGDLKFIKDNFSALSEIIEWHIKGTRFNIKVTDEGFISSGEGITQLTWMDARVGDHVVTPRHGCPVEIQALWYNALNIYLHFGEKIKSKNEYSKRVVKGLITKINKNFRTHFWNKEGYLNDVVNLDRSVDSAIRPNQVYVLSLPFSLLKKTEEKQVFNTIKKHLYTPFGLRTLNQDHPDFRPVYGGDQWSRDTAYHQGTIWPFLLGDYFMAELKINRFSKKAKLAVLKEISALEDHFYKEDGIHSISEIFDGLNPEEGRGTVHQAWSVSGLIKVFIEGELLDL